MHDGFVEDWKGNKRADSAAHDKCPDFYIEQRVSDAMRIVIAYSVQEAIEKLDAIGLKYGYKADVTKLKVVPGSEILNIGPASW